MYKQILTKLFLHSQSEGMTPLHIAAMEGDEGMLKVLSQANARANILDRRDRAPVHLAAERGHTNAVEILLDKFKASITQRTKVRTVICIFHNPKFTFICI